MLKSHNDVSDVILDIQKGIGASQNFIGNFLNFHFLQSECN